MRWVDWGKQILEKKCLQRENLKAFFLEAADKANPFFSVYPMHKIGV